MSQTERIRAVSNKSRRGQVSDAEWHTRVELAACYRLAAREGWTDMIWTHISAAVPGSGREFLLNPFGLGFEEVTASNLVKIDLAGNVILGDHEVNKAGYIIHSAIHEYRHDIKCVMHLHSDAGMALSIMKEGLLPLTQHAMRFHNRIAYHDYEGIVLDADEKTRLLGNLGKHRVMILRNHGFLTAGRSVGEAFVLMYYLEKAARAQLTAMAACAAGGRIVTADAAVAERTALQFNDDQRDGSALEWAQLLRSLDRDDPGYKI